MNKCVFNKEKPDPDTFGQENFLLVLNKGNNTVSYVFNSLTHFSQIPKEYKFYHI